MLKFRESLDKKRVHSIASEIITDYSITLEEKAKEIDLVLSSKDKEEFYIKILYNLAVLLDTSSDKPVVVGSTRLKSNTVYARIEEVSKWANSLIKEYTSRPQTLLQSVSKNTENKELRIFSLLRSKGGFHMSYPYESDILLGSEKLV